MVLGVRLGVKVNNKTSKSIMLGNNWPGCFFAISAWYNTHRNMACLARKVGVMPTQEEKITVLEENITILLGIASGQERDIRSIQVGVMSLDRRFDALEGRLFGMDHRLSTLEKRFDTLEQSVNSRFEEHGNKLDQILLLLNMLTPKPDQGT